MQISGKVAIITGGASGLGEATVRRYVAAGAQVAIFDLDEQRGKSIVTELNENVAYYQVDVTSEESVQEAIDQTVAKFGDVHICNNYAGISSAHKTVGREGAFPLDAYKTVINVNLVGTFNVMRLVAFQMSKQEPYNNDGSRGVIINTSSIAAYEGQIGQVGYSASKGGVVGMTLPAARDLSQFGIRVNAIVPGLVHTPLFDAMPETVYDALSKSPLYPKRLATGDEIAHLSQYIVENEYTNGECIRIDAGLRMQPK